MKYEYMAIEPDSKTKEMIKQLNQLGEEGWMVIAPFSFHYFVDYRASGGDLYNTENVILIYRVKTDA
jgi:hypothetical protein